MRSSSPRWFLAVALVGASLFAAPASAQDTAAETLSEGRRAVTFQPFGSGTTTVGIWRVNPPMSRFGILFNASLGGSRQEVDSIASSQTGFSFGVGPEWRRYTSTGSRVAPFTFFGGRVGGMVNRHNPPFTPGETDWTVNLNAHAGLGAEFFPVRNFGIDAQFGVAADLGYSPIEDPDGYALSASIGTFSAAIGGAFYF